MRAGLIPSRALQEKRIIHEHSVKGVDVANLGERPHSSFILTPRNLKKILWRVSVGGRVYLQLATVSALISAAAAVSA